MNDAAAKARAVVREHLGLTHSRFDGLPLTPKEEQLVSAIAAALLAAAEEARREAIEEAARIADVYTIGASRGNVNSAVTGPAERIAAAIRRLADGDGGDA